MSSQLEAWQRQPLAPADYLLTRVSRAGVATAEGKFLRRGSERFWIKGVTYGSFRLNDAGEPFPPFAQLLDDFEAMKDAGINTVRLYAPPSDRIADAAAEAGLVLVPDICWGPRTCELDDPDRVRFIHEWVRGHSRRLADHPAILMFSIGNEIPPLVVRWYGRQRIEGFLASIAEIVREEAPRNLLTYANHPPTEFLNLPFLDVISFNVYLEREPDFRNYLARLQMLAGEKPLLLAEIGMDSARHGDQRQAAFLDWQLRAAWHKGLCGAVVYSWTDEWAIHSQDIEGWQFGLTDADRRPRPALDAVRRIFARDHYELRDSRWPRVSIVVASYNGARTLDECLASLARLNFPNYEVIVIDDGSTDATRDVLARHRVRAIHVANGGLSRARNLGIAAATGSIVAFLDSDAFADPDWLYFLVQSVEEHDAAAVGGPNLAPPSDGFLAQCIDCTPGNPMHVLIDNEAAEHVPGCNMAFRKDRLEAIGQFDPAHHVAGDDVDVCWKLLAAGQRIAFSPSAIVWHHRRSTIRGFWRQQVGYGEAEAHLQRTYPGRFNWFGDLVWAGSIYDGAHTRLRREGLPSVFRPRVYQGRFGSAQFQSIYQPFLTWWFQIFTTPEWHVVTLSVLLAGLLSVWQLQLYATVLLPLCCLMLAMSLVAAAIPAVHGATAKRWRGASWWCGCAVILGLHWMQPLARAAGRIRGWWNRRKHPPLYSADQRLYGNLAQRDEWLNRLPEHFAACGWLARPCGEWDSADIEVLGPGPYHLKLCSVYEDDVEFGQHYVRYRITSRIKPVVPVLWAALIALLLTFLATTALAPLAIPVVGVMWMLWDSRRAMTAAASQLAQEAAAPLGMIKVQN
jgi:O-antigen biosynthesis protein